jgi:hypothetical protein
MEENRFYKNGKLFIVRTYFVNGNKIVEKYVYKNNSFVPYNENSDDHIEKYDKDSYYKSINDKHR